MTTTAIEELEVPIPDYMDRLLAALAKGTRTAKEDVALFFLLQQVEHTCCGEPNPAGVSQ